MYKKKKIFILILLLFLCFIKKKVLTKRAEEISSPFVSSSLNASLCESMPIICQIGEYGPWKKAGMKRLGGWGGTAGGSNLKL